MTPVSREELTEKLVEARIRSRLRRIIRYVPEEIKNWELRDFLAVTDKSRREGALLFEDYVVPFALSARTRNAHGRTEAIICDICASWRRGPESAVITFSRDATTQVSYLVCGDLDCSLHVRGVTDAGKLSRTQIREDITPDGRITRLHERLRNILGHVTNHA